MDGLRVSLVALVAMLLALPADAQTSNAGQQRPPATMRSDDITAEMGTLFQTLNGGSPNADIAIPRLSRALDLLHEANRRGLGGAAANVEGFLQVLLGQAYFNRTTGDRAQNIDAAIAAYEAAAAHLNPTADAELWSGAQLGIADAYASRRNGVESDNKEHIIAALEASLRVYTRASDSERWARIQDRLGSLYRFRSIGDANDNSERALAAYRNALEVRTRDKEPSYWAQTHIGIGMIYENRPHHDGQDFEHAIEEFTLVRDAVDRAQNPRGYAMLQNYLATIYADRTLGDRGDNIEQAIGFEQTAINTLGRDHSTEWAEAQALLGSLYSHRLRGSRSENLERGIRAIQSALDATDANADAVGWSFRQAGLGLTLLDRIEGDHADNVERAMAALTEALRTSPRDPTMLAIAHHNLALAYSKRVRGDREENLDRALQEMQTAIASFPTGSHPTNLSESQEILGDIYLARQRGGRTQNLTNAVSAYQAALANEQSQDVRGRLIILDGLAQAYSARRDWPAAERTSDEALGIVAHMGAVGVSQADTEEAVSFAEHTGPVAAYAAWRLSDVEGAWSRLESGRARLLSAALGLETLALSDADRQALQSLRLRITQLEAMEAQDAGESRRVVIARLTETRAQAASLIGSGLAASTNSVRDQLVQALQRVDIVLALVVTPEGGVILEAHRGAAGPSLGAIDAPQLTKSHVDAVLQNWFASYRRVATQSPTADAQQAWMQTIAHVDNPLTQMFGGALTAALRSAGARDDDRVLLLLPGGLAPLPLALLRDAQTGRSLLDRYELSQAPNLAVMSRGGDGVAGPPRAAVVANATGDLVQAAAEGAVVSSWFGQGAPIVGPMATRANVVAQLRNADHWHFATHGSFDWVDPRNSGLLLASGDRFAVSDFAAGVNYGRPRLVFLSACETGLAYDSAHLDEFVGLPTAFVEAGAQGVIASLWAVSDISTSLMTMKFYELHIGRGERPALALRHAQLWLRDTDAGSLLAFVEQQESDRRMSDDQADPLIAALQAFPSDTRPFQHAFYWGGFVILGA